MQFSLETQSITVTNKTDLASLKIPKNKSNLLKNQKNLSFSSGETGLYFTGENFFTGTATSAKFLDILRYENSLSFIL